MDFSTTDELMKHDLIGETGIVYSKLERYHGYKENDETTTFAQRQEERYNRMFFLAVSGDEKFFLKRVRTNSRELEFYRYMGNRNAEHPNMMTLEDVIPIDGNTFLVFPFIPYKEGADNAATLKSVMDAHIISGIEMDVEHVLDIGTQVSSFLAYLNEHNAMHLDIKPGNIILSPCVEGYIAKVFDFEGAKVGKRDWQRGGNLVAALGKDEVPFRSPMYSAPELMCAERFQSPMADSYSLAAIMYDMLWGPREEMKHNEFMRDMNNGSFKGYRAMAMINGDYTTLFRQYGFLVPEDISQREDGVSKNLKGILARCLKPLPAERLTPMEFNLALEDELDQELERLVAYQKQDVR